MKNYAHNYTIGFLNIAVEIVVGEKSGGGGKKKETSSLLEVSSPFFFDSDRVD